MHQPGWGRQTAAPEHQKIRVRGLSCPRTPAVASQLGPGETLLSIVVNKSMITKKKISLKALNKNVTCRLTFLPGTGDPLAVSCMNRVKDPVVLCSRWNLRFEGSLGVGVVILVSVVCPLGCQQLTTPS